MRFRNVLSSLRRLSFSQMASRVEVSRLMHPDDANLGGNVHGGTILRLIEQAGWISATRHCNALQSTSPVTTGLARLEHVDFVRPMHIGNVALVHASVSYASAHSLMVSVHVESEDVMRARKETTNRATLWYVAFPLEATREGVWKAAPVPPVPELSDEEKRRGHEMYLMQKQDRETPPHKEDMDFDASDMTRMNSTQYSVSYSVSSLSHGVSPSDCVSSDGPAQGGVLMKLMDTVAGMVAFRHARTSVVTASIDAINFYKPTFRGEVVTVSGRLIFTSERSMIIQVAVISENLVTGGKKMTTNAYFTFVSLDRETRRPVPVPQLVLETEDERRRHAAAEARYKAAKARRGKSAA